MKKGLPASKGRKRIAQDRIVLCIQCICTCLKTLQRLTILKEDRFLRLMNDELGAEVEILSRIFVNERLIVTLVFDDVDDPFCHMSLSSFEMHDAFFLSKRGGHQKKTASRLISSVILLDQKSFHYILSNFFFFLMRKGRQPI